MTAVDHRGPAPFREDAAHAASATGKASRRLRVLRSVGAVVVTALLTGLVVLAGAVVVVPRVIGAVPLAVLSGSMEPAISPGDLVVSRPVAAEDIRMGDVITFQPEADNPTLVTHRVVGVTLGIDGVSGFVTRGDANSATDAPILADQVMGRVAYSVPLVGYVTSTGWGPQVVGVAAVGLLVYGLVTFVLPDRKSNGSSDRATNHPSDRTNREEAHDA